MKLDGTRTIFWLDLLVLLVASGLVALHKWDLFVALIIGLIITNYFDRLLKRMRDQ